MKTFPANERGINLIPSTVYIAGITEAFVELYRATGDEKYFSFAKNVQYDPHWFYEPWTKWQESATQRGFHLYVMVSHLYPETELYRLTGNRDYLLKSLWLKHELLESGHGALLVTGSSSEKEHFTYNQKGDGNIEESCATAYLLRLFDSLMRLDGDMRIGNVMERTIYNALFAAQRPDGRRICYFTPFTGKRVFQDHDTFCCNGNFRRAIAELPEKVFYRTDNNGIALNLYTAANKLFDIKSKQVRLDEKTDYPNNGNVTITLTMSEEIQFSLRFRTPAWCQEMKITINQEKPLVIVPQKQQLGYYDVDRLWKSGDTIHLSIPMEWRAIRGRMEQDGRFAILRGPVLFCLGEDQNKDLVKELTQKGLTPRDLILDLSTLTQPDIDNSIRPAGQKVTVRAWMDSSLTGKQVDVVLTEFTDPSGLEVYFRLPSDVIGADSEHKSPVRIMDDELFFEPRTTPQ